MNKQKLAAKMVGHGDTQRDLANAMGISLCSMNAKLNGWRGSDFREREIRFVVKRYKMTPKEAYDIFFAEE